MAILILALPNYLLHKVSPGGPTIFGAGQKVSGFGIPRWSENACPSLVPWTYQCAKTPSFMCFLPWIFIHLPSLKKQTPLSVQLPVQISVTSNSTVLNSRFYLSFLFRNDHSVGHGSSYKNLQGKTVSYYLNDAKKSKRILC